MLQSSRRAGASPFLSREESKALAERGLSFSQADETRVNVTSGWSGNTRFAAGQITTSGDAADTSVEITVTIGKRRASASTNVLDDPALKRTVDLAARLARLSPEDPELMPELDPQAYSKVNSFIERTANLGGDARAGAVKRTIDRAAASAKAGGDMFVAGFLVANAGATAVATSRGLFGYHRSTDVDLSVTVRSPDATGSGWARSGLAIGARSIRRHWLASPHKRRWEAAIRRRSSRSLSSPSSSRRRSPI